ncbi:hypothetical protein LELG_00043 [Lodderomyces elongisporus NRRL YB-4239]|uniref:Nucleoporin n=1 Tax=Lodderomyces elongisporus (strain ATCC 11503 / CBS 2605 / JCM 1781 / NBRC 1676 / NRRL YB-4239) TaxID=379508 RepID=A5DRQ7_LODEL|nr:hypothetical protein LELG_00043 [Lodderomyces elongisporus NRRL YB-4239]
MSFQWSPETFAEIYNAIKFQPDLDLSTIDLESINNDLLHVLITPLPLQESRSKLEKPVKFSNGDEVQLNQPFVETSVVLATELDLDEVCTAELLFNAQELSFKKGTLLTDSAKLSYYLRYEYILNILGYLINQKVLNLNVEQVFDNAIASFKKIYTLIGKLNDAIDKEKVTGDVNNLVFINAINFAKRQLFKCHELLGLILFGLSQLYFDKIGKLKNFQAVIDVAKSLDNNDILLIHFIPFVLNFYKMSTDNSTLMNELYSQITKRIPLEKSETYDLSQTKIKAFEILIDFVFFTEFIPWCKAQNSSKYTFQDSIIKYMEQLIGYGAMEILLNFCAETANNETQQVFELSHTYDFRSLLQRNFPHLEPTKFVYPGTPELLNAARQRPDMSTNILKLTDVSFLKLDPNLNDSLISPLFQTFFSSFISNAALILTSLRDSEEDFVLSFQDRHHTEEEEEEEEEEEQNQEGGDGTGAREKEGKGAAGKNNNYPERQFEETSDGNNSDNDRENGKHKSKKSSLLEFDQIAQRADLERFYLAFAYNFNNRPELCSEFWNDEEMLDVIIGFLSWGLSNNTSPLIVASFCALLASLTSGGSHMATRIWDILIHNSLSMKKNDFSRISIDSIHDSLAYYIDSLKTNFDEDLAEQVLVLQKKHEFMFTSKPPVDVDGSGQNHIIIELAEDSIVSIAGFTHLLSSIIKNLSDNSPRDREIRKVAFQRFMPIIGQFMTLDNLINGGKILQVNINAGTSSSPKYIDLPEIHVSNDSRVILLNLVFRLLGNFADNHNNDDAFMRYEIWRLLDRWMYHGLHLAPTPGQDKSNDVFGKEIDSRKYTRKRSLGMIEVFSHNLTHYSEILNFTDLVKRLLGQLGGESAFDKYTLAYPCDLGFGYRPNNQIGVWPYMQFILLEVFAKSNDLTNLNDRIALQSILLSTCIDSLSEVDWRFLSHTALKVIRDFKSFETIFDSLMPGIAINYDAFVKLHHSLAIICYFFDAKAYKALLRVIDIGVDAVNSSPEVGQLVGLALELFSKLLDIQKTYQLYLLPVLKSRSIVAQPVHRNSILTIGGTSTSLVLSLAQNQQLISLQTIFENIYLAKSLGSQGVNSFYEILLFHIHSIVHIALFVNCENSISKNALKILKGITESAQFSRAARSNTDPLINNDRLLTTFQNIDESEKLKFAFIDKFEEVEDSLDMKFDILELISSILDQSKNSVNVAHLLLGYEIKGYRLFWKNDSVHSTFLEVLLNTLSVSLTLISELDYNNGNRHLIDVGPAKLSSLILQILIKLCKSPVSASLTTSLIRNYDSLVNKLIISQPKLDLLTIWGSSGSEFNGDLSTDIENKFINSILSIDAFISFIKQRELALELLSIEYYSADSADKKKNYTSLLMDKNEFPSSSAKILDFLDVLNYIFKNFNITKYDSLNRKFDMNLILEEVDESDYRLNYSVLRNTFRILCQGSTLFTPEAKQSFSEELMVQGNKIHEFVTKYLVMTNTRDVQFNCLVSWCLLVKILIIEDQIQSSDLIIEIFNSILPKVLEYLESDVAFSEELVSLCVSLFEVYCKKFCSLKKGALEKATMLSKILPLLQTSINGISSSYSTPNFRAVLYSVFNKFLLESFDSSSLSIKIVKQIKAAGSKLIPTICNDLSYSEGLARINAIFALEAMLRLGISTKTDSINESMTQTNFLSQMLRSIRRTDQVIHLASRGESHFSFNELFVDLTAFKATLYLLIKLAQTKLGALQILQNELFSTLRSLKLLQIDPDLGLNLFVSETREVKSMTIKVLLDTPLSLTDLVNTEKNKEGDENTISYFDLVIPIFELISTILVTMGPNYKPAIIETNLLMKENVRQLVIGVLKREYLLDSNQVSKEIYEKDNHEINLLKKLVHSFTVINSLAA